MSSTMPPDQPTQSSATTSSTGNRGLGGTTGLANFPLNTELLVYVVATLILALLWAATDLEEQGFATMFTAVTFAYLISRGIAKASRVYEETTRAAMR